MRKLVDWVYGGNGNMFIFVYVARRSPELIKTFLSVIPHSYHQMMLD